MAEINNQEDPLLYPQSVIDEAKQEFDKQNENLVRVYGELTAVAAVRSNSYMCGPGWGWVIFLCSLACCCCICGCVGWALKGSERRYEGGDSIGWNDAGIYKRNTRTTGNGTYKRVKMEDNEQR